jgi:hypothetical protein
MRHQDPRSDADPGGEDGDVLRVGKRRRPVAVVRCRTVDLDWNRTEELLEERGGVGQLGGSARFRRTLATVALGEHQTKKAKLAKNQDRVTGARAS